MDFNTAETANRLISTSIPVERPGEMGVYFLIRRSAVIYVGQSVDVRARVWAHYLANKFKFTSWNWTEAPMDSLDEAEAFWILALRPEFNKSLPVNRRFMTEAAMRRWSGLGIETHALKRFLETANAEPIEFNGVRYYDTWLLSEAPGFSELPRRRDAA